MPTFLSRYATPFTTGLFLVSLISGIALFFHFSTSAFREMHEWLSMVLILPFILHIWKNWRPFLTYFKRPPMAIALGLSLAAGIVMAWPALTGESSVSPQVAMIELVTNGTPAQVAPLYGQTEEAFIAILKEKGFTAAETGKSLVDIATASGKGERDVAMTLTMLKQ
ncbi:MULTISPECIES: DUF4405 domain-containing protein [Alphaproteobacteria]|uniref:Flavinylation-associated cytochrome domain-containing protein n=2 Tax=Alphaproteobacteria TaxID=28211 RepID=A0A512HMZ3_9HYPH|nr:MULTISPECIES: DUF4405 domain-containing protein [Alphaproteobacteria]GEO86770.1 hypothetical protein RNA01_37020 [Ciceribacter naphthalenivorans]GLR23349.1 hypothetical protein GCM10007920_31400 [Ciceribacter naphthalenivorans]GLT06205.1 hypothetical protein GCM10007926_31400 [Sphingomonas psychrolutea]